MNREKEAKPEIEMNAALLQPFKLSDYVSKCGYPLHGGALALGVYNPQR